MFSSFGEASILNLSFKSNISLWQFESLCDVFQHTQFTLQLCMAPGMTVKEMHLVGENVMNAALWCSSTFVPLILLEQNFVASMIII